MSHPHALDSVGTRCTLTDPLFAPQADAFLCNRRMMIQATCRGYAIVQFMQPEPAKYAHIPALSGTSFMQPEQPYFAHHRGRFFYVGDDDNRTFFTAPYEPACVPLHRLEFSAGLADIRWLAVNKGLELRLELSLTAGDVVELWSATPLTAPNEHAESALSPISQWAIPPG